MIDAVLVVRHWVKTWSRREGGHLDLRATMI